MFNKAITKDYYINKLVIEYVGNKDFEFYLIVRKDKIKIHFFEFKELNTNGNYGQNIE
jgi:hypothetical protein